MPAATRLLHTYLLGRFHRIPRCCCVQFAVEMNVFGFHMADRSPQRRYWAKLAKGRVPCTLHAALLGIGMTGVPPT